MATLPRPVVAAAEVPLCVDLDGTLIRTDLLFESLLSALRRRWWISLLLPLWMLRGKAYLKYRIAEQASVDPALLPYREDLLDWLRAEHRRGRNLVLATGSHYALARRVAEHLGIFDKVYASTALQSLTGETKARRLAAEYGEAGFDYAGDSAADYAVWARARRRIAAGAAASGKAEFDTRFRDSRSKGSALLRAMRPKHWVKNILVFVPLLSGHQLLDLPRLLHALAIFAAFSIAASGVYVVNDLLDLASDRQHPVKSRRPFAAGDLPVQSGLLLGPALLSAGLLAAFGVGTAAGGVLAFYLALTFVYTFWLKRKLLTDVFTLALLYTLRMLAGAAATGVLCSMWLLAFSVFLFLSLAFLKRSAELGRLSRISSGGASGRSYFTWDLLPVQVFGVTAAYLSSLVLGLYVTSDVVRGLYRDPAWLWLVIPVHLYWMSRAWILSHRGAMNEDPILFAFSDRVTWFCGAGAALALAMATKGGIPIPGVAQ